MPSIISLDKPDTWPESVIRFASATAERLDGSAMYTNDLRIDPEEEDAFRATSLAEHLLLAYHCTRLLHHETDSIRINGLRRLTRELIDERIDLAAASGAITEQEAMLFRGGHAFAVGQEAHREGQVCLFASRRGIESSQIRPSIGPA